MTIRTQLLTALSLLFFQVACHVDNTEMAPARITVSPVHSNEVKASDLFTLTGFVQFQDPDGQALRSISKVLFADTSIIVLDGKTDFEDIYRFDSKGKFLNKIGRQSELEGGYNELYDIDLNAEKNQVIGFSTGNTSFMCYDLQGNLLQQLRNGSLGSHFATLPDGGYVVYNEFGATKISGYNFLVFYDKFGNVTKRCMPYPASIDNYGYKFTGFLGKTGEGIVFSSPFSDTLYAIRNNKVVPLHTFDFLDKTPPASMKTSRLENGRISLKISYLNQDFVKIKHLSCFHFMDQQGPTLGIYDEVTGKFWDASCFKRNDPLYPLIQQGDIFPTSNGQMALVLEPKVIDEMLRSEQISPGELSMTFPELAKAILENKNHPAYIMLYLEAK